MRIKYFGLLSLILVMVLVTYAVPVSACTGIYCGGFAYSDNAISLDSCGSFTSFNKAILLDNYGNFMSSNRFVALDSLGNFASRNTMIALDSGYGPVVVAAPVVTTQVNPSYWY